MASIEASARRIRHCCSVRPWLRSEARKCRITASPARSSDIGSERENSRIGTRRTREVISDFERALSGDFIRAIINRPQIRSYHFELLQHGVFALQQKPIRFDRL